MPDYQRDIIDAIRDEDHFVRATFSRREPVDGLPWTKVTARPVAIKGTRHVQFAYYDAKKCITKNYRDAAVAEEAARLLTLPFRNITVETTADTLQVQISAHGKARIHRGKVAQSRERPDLSHDRQKQLTLPADSADAFLIEVGIMSSEGKVRADQQRKFRQINEFLKIVEQTIEHAGGLDVLAEDGLSIVDCGCGNAYLTFATYHYFSHVRGVPVTITGIDVNGELLERHEEKVRRLGWSNLTFQTTPIVAFQPARPPDIVLALHACDTATDETLARAVQWRSRLIFAVPCCHHHLQQQLGEQKPDGPRRPMLRHGVLAERLGDVLTDNFRALLLWIMGYETDVLEFVESEHTAKNLMIRAIRRGRRGREQALREYAALKQEWQVTPYLEELLRPELEALMPSEQVEHAYP